MEPATELELKGEREGCHEMKLENIFKDEHPSLACHGNMVENSGGGKLWGQADPIKAPSSLCLNDCGLL